MKDDIVKENPDFFNSSCSYVFDDYESGIYFVKKYVEYKNIICSKKDMEHVVFNCLNKGKTNLALEYRNSVMKFVGISDITRVYNKNPYIVSLI